MAYFNFADNTKPGRATHTLKGSAAIRRDLARLWKWAHRNVVKFNKSKRKGREKPCATLQTWGDCLGRGFAEKGKRFFPSIWRFRDHIRGAVSGFGLSVTRQMRTYCTGLRDVMRLQRVDHVTFLLSTRCYAIWNGTITQISVWVRALGENPLSVGQAKQYTRDFCHDVWWDSFSRNFSTKPGHLNTIYLG